MPKFDYIIQNPPYSGNLHIQIENFILDNALSEKGKMVIIQPASWLIDVRKPNGRNKNAPIFDELKNKLGKHVYKVVIENLNKQFDTALYVPFSITYINMNKEYDKIDFWCCGEHRVVVNNLYDCNLIGDYDMIWSILNKIKSYGEKVGTMKDHIYKEGKTKVNEETWFCKYPEIFGGAGSSFCGIEASAVGGRYDSTAAYINHFNGTYITPYISAFYHYFGNNIQQTPLCSFDRGKNLTDKIANNIYGSKQELENWKHFVFNNKIPLFTSIVLVISQNNRVKDLIPWLVDKKYNDEEIYKLLNITEEEQRFIDKTLKKYERHSPWFKRYMCGPDSVSDEEVQKFINIL